MELNKLYRNINNTDVALEPHTITEAGDNLFIYGTWWNVTGTKKFPIKSDQITMKKIDEPNWKEYVTKS